MSAENRPPQKWVERTLANRHARKFAIFSATRGALDSNGFELIDAFWLGTWRVVFAGGVTPNAVIANIADTADIGNAGNAVN